jgi:DNA invertase Pin-like site-specific DNA recombinase
VQVREHTESTLRQYDLTAQAARLGWPGIAIEVIDADLGLSGRTASHRDGFKQLVARVCLGEVGAMFGLEVSRLARSNADLARLLELAASPPPWSSTPTVSMTCPTSTTGCCWG